MFPSQNFPPPDLYRYNYDIDNIFKKSILLNNINHQFKLTKFIGANNEQKY